MAIDKEKIYHKLKEAIITTELEPNMRLNEKELINRFKISRTPLREILIRLQGGGVDHHGSPRGNPRIIDQYPGYP